MFFECNLSFNLARHDAFLKFVSAVGEAGPSFKAPSSETLRTKELRAEVMEVEKELQPMKASWERYGCTILSDGWSDARRRPLINILVSSCQGTVFLKAIDASGAGVSHTGEYIFRHIKNAIEEVGPKNVVQVVTDNAANCVLAGKMIETDYPSISWVPCASHSINLLIEDIGKLEWVARIVHLGSKMISFLTRKHSALSIYRKYATHEILKPSKTRFAYLFIVLQRLVKVRPCLRRMIVSEEWIAWPNSTSPKAINFEATISDASFWHDAECIVGVLRPLIVALRLTDSEGCTMGILYEFMEKVGEAFDSNTWLDRTR